MTQYIVPPALLRSPTCLRAHVATVFVVSVAMEMTFEQLLSTLGRPQPTTARPIVSASARTPALREDSQR